VGTRTLAALLAVLALASGCAPRSPALPGRPTSVLLVTIDTLRADRLGAYGDALARTPNLDRLAREAVVFEKVYSPAPITLPAHASLMTGLLPPAHGVRGNGTFALGPEPRTLAESLAAKGWQTAAFVGAFPLSRRFGLGRGFAHYDDTLPRAPGLHFEFPERRAPEVVAAARGWLAKHPGPVFLWVHLFDPHAPYDPPAPFAGSDPYRGEIAAVDAALGPLLADWEARGPALTVVTSDHGEAFGEHGEESHSLFVYDTTLHVPLLVRGPGLAPRRVADPVGLVDVAATVLGAVGAAGGLPGRDLLGSAPAGPLYAETLAPHLDFGWSELRSLREGRLKYVRAPRPELYDVVADPREAHDLATARAAEARRMDGALQALLARTDERASRRAADPEAEERLRALGYVQGPGGQGSGADPKDKVEVARRIAQAAGPFPDHAAAARVYGEIAALDPGNPLVEMRLADALLRSGRARESLPHFERVVAGRPRSADPHVGLATALAELGRLGEAERVLKDALAVDPSSGQVHFNLGEIARARGDRAAAREAYGKASRDPAVRERAQARLAAIG
jgi:choline-sulfatase